MNTTIWFTSDLHLGHRHMVNKRGYMTARDHDSDIVFTLMKQVKKEDILYVLGDVAFGRDELFLMNAIDCRKILIMGNHDNMDIQTYSRVFERIMGAYKKYNCLLTHIPIHPQEMYRVEANIHGHIHKGAATGILPFPYINVNWEYWGRAVSKQEIDEVIKHGGTTYPSQLTSIPPRL